MWTAKVLLQECWQFLNQPKLLSIPKPGLDFMIKTTCLIFCEKYKQEQSVHLCNLHQHIMPNIMPVTQQASDGKMASHFEDPAFCDTRQHNMTVVHFLPEHFLKNLCMFLFPMKKSKHSF